jgi:hypothetical protein
MYQERRLVLPLTASLRETQLVPVKKSQFDENPTLGLFSSREIIHFLSGLL